MALNMLLFGYLCVRVYRGIRDRWSVGEKEVETHIYTCTHSERKRGRRTKSWEGKGEAGER